MNLEVDVHTHTTASGHAYSSLNEMAEAASKKDIKIMGTTDHGPKMPGGAHLYHFHNIRVIPEFISGVRILKGIEANIIDFKGGLDAPVELLKEMELVIASFHGPCIEPAGITKTTDALLKLMENRYVNIIGHPEDRRFKFDLESVVSSSKTNKTLLEVNNSSLLPTTFREDSRNGIISILEECGRQSVQVVFGSDAHHTSSVGRFDMVKALIKEIGFPESLIINRSSSEFLKYIT
ncbi:MAG: phosphatase [Spirochaetaceae bacterium]